MNRIGILILFNYLLLFGACSVKHNKEYAFSMDDDLIPIEWESSPLFIRDPKEVEDIAKSIKNRRDSDDMQGYGNWFGYFRCEKTIPGYRFIVRSSDGDCSERLYLLRLDDKKIKFCIEVASKGGDGADHFSSFSIIRGDSLIKYNVTETCPLDPVADTFLSYIPMRDTTIVRTLLQ